MKIALTIAGSDSCCGAGIQQDLKVFSSLKIYGLSVITAVTAQNTRQIKKILPLDSKTVAEQIDAIFSDIRVDAVKTGMLANSKITNLVYEKIKKYKVKNLVVDPVMKSTSGTTLLENDALPALKKLISIATLTTPNFEEMGILSGAGKIDFDIFDNSNFEKIKKTIKKIECKNVVITGGRNFQGRDIFYHNEEIQILESHVKVNEKVHGAGCAFSSAITANLAKGFSVVDSVEKAKNFIDCALARNFSISKGLRILDSSQIMMHKDFYKKGEEEKKNVVESIANAIEIFCNDEKNSYKLIPEVGMNIVMALPNAKNINEIAGLTGRIVRDRNKAVPVGIVKFGGSSHMATVVLTAMKFDAKKRSAMNIKFSEEILDACKKLKLKIFHFDRENEPQNVSTMEWGTKIAIEKCGSVPDIIYDEGGKGKEAMIRLLGKNAREVVNVAMKIVREL